MFISIQNNYVSYICISFSNFLIFPLFHFPFHLAFRPLTCRIFHWLDASPVIAFLKSLRLESDFSLFNLIVSTVDANSVFSISFCLRECDVRENFFRFSNFSLSRWNDEWTVVLLIWCRFQVYLGDYDRIIASI